MTHSKKAVLYRMKIGKTICPFGLKSKDLLKRKGYDVEDHPLTSRDETDAFKAEHDVTTTPQTFIDGTRIGGYDDLKQFFGISKPDPNKKTYRPVIAVFAVTFLMALASVWLTAASFDLIRVIELFIAFSMCMLGILKLQDLEAFSLQFLGYDLLAQKYVPYAKIYPFAEVFVGLCMIGMVFIPAAAAGALFIGTIGAASVFKAVYLDKRDLKCACVGGKSNVPLGAISLTENLMMIVMGLWMLFAY
jgi:glutaredoxin